MIYDPEQKKGVRKKCLPEPNPTKIEVESNATLLDLQRKAKELYFEEYYTSGEELIMSDSSGIPIYVSNPKTWTLGTFYESHSLQPSKYKMYFMLDLKVTCSYT